MDTAKWLEENGMDCRRYGARISRAACATYQKTGDMASCGTCPDAVRGVKPLPMKKKPIGRGLHLYIDQGIRLAIPEPAPQPEPPPSPVHVRPRQRPKRSRQGQKPYSNKPKIPDLEAGIVHLAQLGNRSAQALIMMMEG